MEGEEKVGKTKGARMTEVVKEAIPLVKIALEEDVGKGDITTELIIPEDKRAVAKIIAREGGIIAGLPVAELAFKTIDESLKFSPLVEDGERVKRERVIAEIRGKAKGMLMAERVALNFLQRLSGIATLTFKFVEKVQPYKVKIFDTRKTTPGWRKLEKYAVRMGGGYNHRMGLYDMVLIKDNHIKVQKAKYKMQNLIKVARRGAPQGMKIEVEAGSLDQVKEAFLAGADVIMLDNMKLKEMEEAVRWVREQHKRKKVIIEASGGVSLDKAAEIAKTGVDWISVGALTHSPRALNISMEMEEMGNERKYL